MLGTYILVFDGEEVLIQSEDLTFLQVTLICLIQMITNVYSDTSCFSHFRVNIIQVNSIYNSRHNRIISRLSWKVGNKYLPMSFICDTGATRHIYLSKLAYSMLNTANRIIEDPDLGAKYVIINGRKAAVLPTPDNYEPAMQT